jgi:large subunit ribosomal protein L9
MDIADALKAQGYEIDRRKIIMKDAIKETGDFTVNVKLHREVTLVVPVTVTAEGAEPAPVEEKKAKAEEAATAESAADEAAA